MDSFLFIVNPNAGLKTGKHIEEKIDVKSKEYNKKILIEYTKDKGHASYLALKYLHEGIRNIVCVGGDGTLREILQVLAGKSGVNIGIVPCGSGNGAARNLKIPIDIEKSIDIIFKGKTVLVDCGICNGQVFINTCGVGLDAYIAYGFNKGKVRGILPYFISGIKSYFTYQYEYVELEYSNNKYGFYPLIICIANGRQYGGGAIISPNSSMADGTLEAIVVEKASIMRIIRQLPTLFNGRILENHNVKSFSSRNFRIKIKPKGLYHLDGEDFISDDGYLRISVYPKAVSFFTENEIL